MRPARRGGRQKIVPNSLRLPYFASYFFSFFFSQRRRAAKECKALNNFLLWGNFNLLLQRSNIFFFAQGVVFRSVWLPEALAAWRAFLVRRGGFSSHKDAETCPPRWAQRNCGLLGLTSAGREPARKCQSCSKTPCCKTCHSLYFFGIAFSGLIFMFR